MHVLKSFFIAVSLYSKIPVPQFEWNREDMKYVLCFLPWIGAVIGISLYLWNRLCIFMSIGTLCRVTVDAAILLLITGGFHADGFLDVMDAFCSYRSKEQKLEILSDAHIGAFAVIMFALYGLIFMGAFSEIREICLLKAVCVGFFLSRCLCGISALLFPPAKREGMLYSVTDGSGRILAKLILCLQGIVSVVLMVYLSGFSGLFVALSAFAAFIYYYYRSRKEFGGVTGDTSGYFVLLCEACMVVTAAVIDLSA